MTDGEQKVELQYFKPSGKYYDSAEFHVPAHTPIWRIFEMVKLMDRERRLPGLVSGGGGRYHVLVNVPGHEHEYPGLLPCSSHG